MQFTDGDPEKDFFNQNPHWRYIDSSVKLLKEVSPELASKIRWAIFYMMDPSSKFYNYPVYKRVEIVNRNYLKGVAEFGYDEELAKIIHEDYQYIIDAYPRETMDKIKRDYYEREMSYQLLVQMERDNKDLKTKAEVQLKLSKIYAELEKSREAFESATEEARTKTRGSQQPGILFNKNKR